MLTGQGGNIGVFVGDEGVFMIDDQFAPLSPKILAAIKKLSSKPIKFLINTHHHGDHTGGNSNIAETGALIVAHDNVRKRLANSKSSTESALPVITFSDDMNFHFNGESIMVFHIHNAHTDGDAMVYFANNNVLHTGDVFFSGRYPYIDVKAGGTVNGIIKAIKKVMMLIDDDTKIIPGHGPVSSKTDYQNTLNMLEDLKAKVNKAIKNGKTEDEVANMSSITKKYDDLGYGWSFINGEKVRRALYQSLKK